MRNGALWFRSFFLIFMKSRILTFFSFLFFLSVTSAAASELDFCLDTQGGTFYVDDSGADGIYHKTKFSLFYEGEKLSWQGSVFFGGIPGEVTIPPQDYKVKLDDIYWLGAASAFHVKLAHELSADINLFAGFQDSSCGDLYILPGSVYTQGFGGISAALNLPLDFSVDVFSYGAGLCVNNEENLKIGNADLRVFGSDFTKSWSFGEQHLHQIKTGAGFFYTDLTGQGRASDELDKSVFFPYSYMFANGSAVLYFVSLKAAYTLTAGACDFTLFSSAFINVWSQVEYFYKTTKKKNLLYDGSIQKDQDSFTFSNADFLLLVDATFYYTLNQKDNFKARVFIGKDFVIPYISGKTKTQLGMASSSGGGALAGKKSTLSAKTILLSGLSLGVKLDF